MQMQKLYKNIKNSIILINNNINNNNINNNMLHFFQDKYLYKNKKCHICKGSGWIVNNKKNKGFHFGYDLCKICRGTGII